MAQLRTLSFLSRIASHNLIQCQHRVPYMIPRYFSTTNNPSDDNPDKKSSNEELDEIPLFKKDESSAPTDDKSGSVRIKSKYASQESSPSPFTRLYNERMSYEDRMAGQSGAQSVDSTQQSTDQSTQNTAKPSTAGVDPYSTRNIGSIRDHRTNLTGDPITRNPNAPLNPAEVGVGALRVAAAYRNRHVGEISKDRMDTDQAMSEGIEAVNRKWDPRFKWGLRRGTFRMIIIGLSCVVGFFLYTNLRPKEATNDVVRRNMHFFARLNADPSVIVTYSGLMYKILEQDKDADELHYLVNPDPQNHCVKIHYEARAMSGEIFDSSFDHEPCVFHSASLIDGLAQGLAKMTRDSEYEFFLPPHLAYGEKGSGMIPPHEPLVFKVKLLDFWKDNEKSKPMRFSLDL